MMKNEASVKKAFDSFRENKEEKKHVGTIGGKGWFPSKTHRGRETGR